MTAPDTNASTGDTAPYIEVSSNNMSAALVLPSGADADALSSNDVRGLIRDAGITHGILENVVESFDSERPSEDRVTVAEGIPIENGSNGVIHWRVPTDKKTAVAKGSELAKLHLPGEGKNGVTVYGAVLSAASGKKASVPALENITLTDNDTVLKATIEGYFSLTANTAGVRPYFKLNISQDNLEASVTVAERVDENDFGPADLHEMLKELEITHGILNDEIKRIFTDGLYETPVTVARGQELVDGRDGEIEYLFDHEIKPEMDEQGNVNYKEINLIQNVHKGDAIARITPPVPGRNGFTIFGVESKAKEGVKPQFSPGKNTAIDPSDPDMLLAGIDGSVRLNGGKIEVDEVFSVSKNVDYSTGNIRFIGSVEVNGNINAGFKIKAKGDVQVNGLVEDAVIDCEGSVLIKRGFIGRGHGSIIAGGDVHAAFCENERIIADGDVELESFAMNANIQTRGKLTLVGKKGLLIGGSYFAVKGIEINNAGSEHSEPTLLHAGVDRVLRSRLTLAEEKIKQIDTLLLKNMHRRLIKKEVPPRLKKIIDELREHKKRKENECERIRGEIDSLEDMQDEFAKATVTVNDAVHPGTVVTIFNQQHMVRDLRHGIRFTLDENGYIDEIPLK